jgi:ribosomal protein S18 acetylase RimI-like enzyme
LRSCILSLQNHVAAKDFTGRSTSNDDFDVDTYIRQRKKDIIKNGGGVLLAVCKDTVIGCIIGVVFPPDHADMEHHPATTGEITDLFVDPSFRGMNLGSKLVLEMEKMLTSFGCTLISVSCHAFNADAHAFYQRQGFEDFKIALIKPASKPE